MKKIWKKNMKLFLLLILFLILDVFGEIFTALLFGNIINNASNGNIMSIKNLLLKTVILIVLTIIVFWLYQVYSKKFILKMSTDLKNNIFYSFQEIEFSDFYKEDIGEKISLLTNDMTTIEKDYFQSIISIIRASLLFIFSIITIFLKSYQMGLFLLIIAIISMILPKFFEKNLSNYKEEVSNAQSDYTSRVTEYLYGFETIKSFNIIEKIKINFFNNSEKVLKKAIKYEKEYNYVRAVSIFFGSLTFMSGFLFGGYLVSKKVITIGTMITCIQLTNHLTNPIYTLIEKISSLKSVLKILEKIERTIKIKKDNEEELLEKNSLIEKIVFENINFSYNKENKILNNISLEFEKNKKYLIVGMSGSGKTTLLKLISKKIKPTEGKIFFDNINIKKLSENSILKMISSINQNVFLFKGSIYENIDLNNEYNEEKVKYFLEKVNLKKFSDNINKENFIQENGNNLSGGEKQRISICRALIRETDIILADEIFSSLDDETAKNIENELLNIKDITLISIAHRLFEKNLKKYDKIIVLKNGEIVENDSFENLISKKSYFSNIFDINK